MYIPHINLKYAGDAKLLYSDIYYIQCTCTCTCSNHRSYKQLSTSSTQFCYPRLLGDCVASLHVCIILYNVPIASVLYTCTFIIHTHTCSTVASIYLVNTVTTTRGCGPSLRLAVEKVRQLRCGVTTALSRLGECPEYAQPPPGLASSTWVSISTSHTQQSTTIAP